MTPQEFMNDFGTLADAPGGIKKLRELVLELAIRAKLSSPQRDDDQCRGWLARLRADSDQPAVDAAPFDIPSHWEWARLGDVCSPIHYGYTASADSARAGVRLLRITDIQNDRVDWDAVPGCEIDAARLPGFELHEGNLLIARTGGTIGKTYLVRNVSVRAVFASYLIRAVPLDPVVPEYLKLYTGSPLYWSQLYAGAAGTGQPNVNATTLKGIVLPLPCVAEQKRIVAKVDQLMALLDDLEAKQGKRQHTVVRATSACLDALTTADSPEEVADAWKRVAGNWRVLFDRPEAVGDLSKAVLELAVRGRLVDATLDLVAQDGAPFPVPAGWIWSTIGTLGQTLTGTTPSTRNPEFYGDHIPFVAPGDIADRTLVLPSKGLSKLGLAEGRLVPAGSVLMVCIGGSIGKAAGNDVEVACNQQINAVTPKKGVVRDYLLAAMRAPYFQREVMGRALQGTLPIISKSKWEQIPVPVPPQPMQAKIAAAVGRAFVMCDDLEGKLRRRDERAGKLVAAVVGEIVGAGSHGEVMPTEPSEDRRYATAQETLARVNAAADRKNSRGKNTAVSKARPARKMATT